MTRILHAMFGRRCSWCGERVRLRSVTDHVLIEHAGDIR